MLVDSHCHLNFPDFTEDLDKVLAAAFEKGVKTLLTVNTRLTETDHLQKIAETYSQVFFSVGVHPHEAVDYQAHSLEYLLKEKASHPKAIALGETGLDYYYDKSPRPAQIKSFHHHLQACTGLNLPVIIHTREADDDTLACVDDHPHVKGVFHCFSGTESFARQALDRGFYLSFSGIITFKNAEALRHIVTFTPWDRILVETDAPYLTPVPFRGQRNQPAYTRTNAEKIAEIKGTDLETVARHTTENFFKLFSKCPLPL